MGQCDFEDRSLSNGRIRAHHHGQQIEARLIYEDDAASLLLRLFLSAGQRSSFQRVIAASSRWLACTTGFCTL